MCMILVYFHYWIGKRENTKDIEKSTKNNDLSSPASSIKIKKTSESVFSDQIRHSSSHSNLFKGVTKGKLEISASNSYLHGSMEGLSSSPTIKKSNLVKTHLKRTGSTKGSTKDLGLQGTTKDLELQGTTKDLELQGSTKDLSLEISE